MPNFNKLRGRIVEKFGNQKNFAKAADACYISISYKMSGKRNITYSDVVEWSRLLEIDQKDIGEYFFAQNVKNC